MSDIDCRIFSQKYLDGICGIPFLNLRNRKGAVLAMVNIESSNPRQL